MPIPTTPITSTSADVPSRSTGTASRWIAQARIGATPARITVVALAGVFFLALMLHALSGTIWLAEWDVTNWFVDHRTPRLTTWATDLSTITEPVGVLVIALVVGGAISLRQRSWLPVAVAMAVTFLSAVAIGGLKVIIGRPRPPVSLHLVSESDYGFPSGHSLGTMTVFLTLAWLTTRAVRGAGRALAFGVALVVSLLVGAARIYLGVHWFTDVLAGWAVAAVLLSGLVVLVPRPGQRPQTSPDLDSVTASA